MKSMENTERMGFGWKSSYYFSLKLFDIFKKQAPSTDAYESEKLEELANKTPVAFGERILDSQESFAIQSEIHNGFVK